MVDWIENITMFTVIVGWLGAMVWVSWVKPTKRLRWQLVKRQQEIEDEVHTCIGDIFFAMGEKRMTVTGRNALASHDKLATRAGRCRGTSGDSSSSRGTGPL